MACIHDVSRRLVMFPLLFIGLASLVGPQSWGGEGLPACRQRLTVDCGLREVGAIAFSADGSRIASVFPDGAVKVWDATTGALLLENRDVGARTRSLAYSPTGSRLAVGAIRDGREPCGVILLDATTGMRINEFWRPFLEREGEQVAFASDSRALFASGAGCFSCWDLTTARHTLTRCPGSVGCADCIALSGAGDRIAFSDKRSNIHVYSFNAKRFVHVPRAQHGKITTVAFSPDGTLLASGSTDHEVKVWEAISGKELAVLHHRSEFQIGCIDRVLCVQFAPDGRRLLSAHMDLTLRVWDPIRPAFVASSDLPAPARLGIYSLVFSPDGRSLGAVGSVHQVGVRADLSPSWKIVVWDVPPFQ